MTRKERRLCRPPQAASDVKVRLNSSVLATTSAYDAGLEPQEFGNFAFEQSSSESDLPLLVAQGPAQHEAQKIFTSFEVSDFRKFLLV